MTKTKTSYLTGVVS